MSNNDRFALAHELVSEYATLEAQMADPDIHNDQGKARQLGRRYAQLGPVVAGFREWRLAEDCLLYTSPSPRDRTRSRMPSSA